MVKADIVDAISQSSDIPKNNVITVVNSFFEEIKKSLAKGETVELRGFGTFGFKIRNARIASNPYTGEEIDVPEHVIAYFKCGSSIQNIVKSVSIDTIKDDIRRKKRS